MKKVYNLARAEFNKILVRPSIFILTAILLITLCLTSLNFKPTSTNTKLELVGNSVNEIYNNFYTADKYYGYQNLSKYIDSTYMIINEQYKSITDIDTKNNLLVLAQNIDVGLSTKLQQHLTSLATDTSKFSITSAKTFITSIKTNIKTLSDNLADIKANIQSRPINFYITTEQFEKMEKNVIKIFDTISDKYTDYSRNELIDFCKTIQNSCSVRQTVKTLYNSTNVEISQESFDVITKYHDTATTKSAELFDDIQKYNLENSLSKEQSDIDTISNKIAFYYDYININKDVMSKSFLLLKIGNKTDTQIKEYLGFSEVDKYALTEDVSITNFLLTNNEASYDYLQNFNFNVNSGAKTNALDFVFYTMQILIIFITLFTIYYACSMTAGDHHDGTLKMIAVKPYTRSKIISGKFLACMMFAFTLTVICAVCSLGSGLILTGLPASKMLIAFNGTNVYTLNSYLMIGIYLFSILLDIVYFTSIAFLLSVLSRNSTLSIILTSAFYGAGILINSFISSASLIFTPFAHINLYKFFGNGSVGFLKYNIISNSSFLISGAFMFIATFALLYLTHFIFKKRDIA